MKRFLLLILGAILLIGCSEKKTTPEEVFNNLDNNKTIRVFLARQTLSTAPLEYLVEETVLYDNKVLKDVMRNEIHYNDPDPEAKPIFNVVVVNLLDENVSFDIDALEEKPTWKKGDLKYYSIYEELNNSFIKLKDVLEFVKNNDPKDNGVEFKGHLKGSDLKGISPLFDYITDDEEVDVKFDYITTGNGYVIRSCDFSGYKNDNIFSKMEFLNRMIERKDHIEYPQELIVEFYKNNIRFNK